MNIAATVVLYNPDNNVFNNVKSYAPYVKKIIVIDNSTSHNNRLIKQLKNEFKHLIYINNNDNLGIATALNIACDTALELEADWLLTMDQDSKFINFNKYKNCFLSTVEKIGNIGLVTLNHTHDITSIILQNNECTYEQENIVITSGNFIKLSIFNEIGRFDDSFFIDMVDYDFSNKIILNGYQIIKFVNHYLIHELGEIFKRKNSLTGKIKEKIEHNPQRVYYMTRNRLYMSKKYHLLLPMEYNWLKTINLLFIHDITKILLYEDQKLKKIYAKFLGLYHFLINRKGRYNI